MKLELSIYELGQVLKKVGSLHKLELVTKVTLNGGWMTLMGEAEVISAPSLGGGCHGNNILSIKIKEEGSSEGAIIKLTGAKNKTFNVEIAEGKYKEISKGLISKNTVKVEENECKIKVDDTLVFKVMKSKDEILELIK